MPKDLRKLLFSPDSRLALAINWIWDDKRAPLWDVETGSLLYTFSPTLEVEPADAAFSPDGKFLVVIGGDDRTDALFDVRTGQKIQTFYHGQTNYGAESTACVSHQMGNTS